ncbi:hypothetical protein FKM82_025443 [Ascaphus truei]
MRRGVPLSLGYKPPKVSENRMQSTQLTVRQCILGTRYLLDIEDRAHGHLGDSSKMAAIPTCAPRSKDSDLKWRFPPSLEQAHALCTETIRRMWRDMCNHLAPNPDFWQGERRESRKPTHLCSEWSKSPATSR